MIDWIVDLARRSGNRIDLLLEPGSTVASVADRVGYGSAFAGGATAQEIVSADAFDLEIERRLSRRLIRTPIAKWLSEGLDNAQPAFVGNQNGDIKAAIASAAKKVEAIYSFPLPNDAAVDDMTMIVGERTVRGKILDRNGQGG